MFYVFNMSENNFNFNHRVELQKEVQSEGEFGEINYSFEKIATVWANIMPISYKQNFSKMKHETEITHLIEIRYTKKAFECKKILFNNRLFLVLNVVCPEENYEKIVFNVKEILA